MLIYNFNFKSEIRAFASVVLLSVGLYFINKPLAIVCVSASGCLGLSRLVYKLDYKYNNTSMHHLRGFLIRLKGDYPNMVLTGFITAIIVSQYFTLIGALLAGSIGFLKGITYNFDREIDRSSKKNDAIPLLETYNH